VDITSLQNERVKSVVKLREDKRQRQRDGLMLVEGWDELTLALASGLIPRTVFMAPELTSRPIGLPAVETLTVSRAVFEKMSHREGPDGWLGVFPIPRRSLADLHLRPSPLVILAESVEKPGNLGAILRTADAAGVDGVIVNAGATDIHNPNVVRASLGTLFSVPICEATPEETVAHLRALGVRTVAAVPDAALRYTSAEMRGPVAIIMGSEAYGLSQAWREAADLLVSIPMHGAADSLNLATATALMLYEVVRQRGG